MRVLVCGGREFKDRKYIYDFLTRLDQEQCIEVVIEGEYRGVDTIAKAWALRNEILIDPYPADWDQYGKAAGPIRNRRMLFEGRPHLVVAFPGGDGTANMIQQALEAGFPVIRA